MNKKKIIYTLIAFVILLLICNIIIDGLNHTKIIKGNNIQNASRIEGVFLKVLDDYGIKEDWIKTSVYSNKEHDSLSHQYTVKVPAEIPIPLIIREMNSNFVHTDLKLISEEKKNYGNTLVKIYADNYLKLLTFFKIDNKIKRDSNAILIFVDITDGVDQQDFSELLFAPIPLTLLFHPSTENEILLDKISKHKKEFAVSIDDEVDDRKFALKEKENKQQLTKAIKALVYTFRDSEMFFVNNKSDLYKSTFYNFIKDEFHKKNIFLKKRSKLIQLRGESESDLRSLFKFYCQSITSGEVKWFIINAEDFFVIQDQLILFKQKGNQLIFASEMEEAVY